MMGSPIQNVPLLDIHAVDHCNYHCPECNHASPRTPHRIHDSSVYLPLIERLSEFVHANSICIVGGEPTLHPDLPGFLASLPWQRLANRMRLYTNGHWLLDRPYPDTIVAAIRQVPELHVSLHPELAGKMTAAQIAQALLEIRELAPSVRIHFAPEMTFIVPVFGHDAEPRTSCGSYICLQLEPAGYLCRCPQIRFAAHFANATSEFVETASRPDTRYHILSGTFETFSVWYHSWPAACSYCRWGSSHALHSAAFWSASDIRLIARALGVEL
jgi:hypothetical protein